MEGNSGQFELHLQQSELEIQALAEAEADADAEAAGEEEREALREEMVRFIEESRRVEGRRARETSGRMENGLGRRTTLLVVSFKFFLPEALIYRGRDTTRRRERSERRD